MTDDMQAELERLQSELELRTSEWNGAQEIIAGLSADLERMLARIGELEKEREWRPMEDAPHGLKLIVRYRNQLWKNRTIMACYYDAGTLDLSDQADDTGDGFAEEGWYEECENNETVFRVHEELLGWQHTPKPPEQKP